MAEPVNLLGVGFDSLTREEALSRLLGYLSDDTPRLVVTPNPEILVQCRTDARLLAILQSADLRVADGVGILIGARLKGTPLPARLPGIDLAAALLAAVPRGTSVAFLGGVPGVAAEAASHLSARLGHLRFVWTGDGYFPPEREEEMVGELQASAPQVLLVGMGSPRQERFLARHYRQIGASLNMGVGGSFDVWAGRTRRAPEVMRRMGMEWVYRGMTEPWRLPRLLRLPRFLWEVLRWEA